MAKMSPDDIEFLFPITSVTVHPNGHLTVNRKPRFKPPNGSLGNKKEISKLSKKSLRRLNHIMQTTLVDFGSMITLTYGKFYPNDGAIVKEDLRYIMRYIKEWSKSWLWFLEFQKRGAPHFHILLSADCVTPKMRYLLCERWLSRQLNQDYFYAHVPAGDHLKEIRSLFLFNINPKVWELIRDDRGAVKYVAKYANKVSQKNVPREYCNVGRFWGCSKDVKNTLGVTVDISSTELLQILSDHNHLAKEFPVIPKYIWGVMNDTN